MKLEKFKEKDKKKIGIIIFTVSCVFLIAGVFLYKTFALFEAKDNLNIIEGQVQDLGDLYFAFYIDDVISSTMPGKDDGYVLDSTKSTCNNGATPELNQEDWSIKVKNMTQSRTKCTLYFKEQTFISATTYITNLATSGDTSLVYDNTTDNNLRYIGADPNNYVRFNNELWRVIGVMNSIQDEQGKTDSKLKLMKSSRYTEALGWDSSMGSDWSVSTTQIEFNTSYYESLSNKEMIDSVVWKLGSPTAYSDSTNGLVKHWYQHERGEDVTEKWTGHIALPYISDYGYAVGGPREYCLAKEMTSWNDFLYDECKTNNWIYNVSNSQWSLTAGGRGVFVIDYYVWDSRSTGDGAIDVVPTLFLKSNVAIIGGNGSSSDPFILDM